jgi:signal transduction histidine kinase/ActR/RegA family two-component response regulator
VGPITEREARRETSHRNRQHADLSSNLCCAPMSPRLRQIVIRAVALPFLLALVLAGLTTAEILYLSRLSRSVEHSRAVLAAAGHTYRLVIDEETGIRGYLLSGSPRFLEPYQIGRTQIPDALKELRRLVADNPAQIEHERGLSRALEDWNRRAAGIVGDGAPGTKAPGANARSLASLTEAKGRMDRIRDRVDALVDEERLLLAERRADYDHESRVLVLGGGALVLALGMAIALVLRAQIRSIETIYREALAERESSEQRERKARSEAETANRVKDEFLATVSHELRTPLTAMLGWARLLRGDRVEEARRARAVEAIERNAIAQAQLIEDLLDVSRITSGKLRLDLHETDLRQVIDAAIDAVRPALEAKQIRFQTVLDPTITNVLGDPNRLQQVVWNLLANAIKFTPKCGHVQVTLAWINSHIELAVRDSGQGIDAAFLPRLFQRFHQADSSESRAHGGLGLGLAISRHLVELHGGTIEAHSEGPGQGALFTVKLPRLPVSSATAVPAPREHPTLGREAKLETPPELHGLKVLVVDDEPDARELVMTVLGQCGCLTEGAASVRQALDVVSQFKPDVILSDIGMPGEDGYELARRLRQRPPEQGGRIPAAALTAYARAEDRRRAMRAGFEMHLPKPVEPAELVAALATLARIGDAMK